MRKQKNMINKENMKNKAMKNMINNHLKTREIILINKIFNRLYQ